MNTFLKFLGIILILIGAIMLVIGYITGFTNDNWFSMLSYGIMIIGLISYIILNKRIV